MTEEPKMIKHETIEYRGFKSVEEAKRFLEEARKELDLMVESMHRQVERLFSFGIRWPSLSESPLRSIDREIEYHREQIRKLEEERKRYLPPPSK